MRIAVLDDYQDAFRRTAGFDRLAAHAVTAFRDTVADEALADRLAPFEAVVLIQQRTRLPASVIRALPNLRFVSQTGRNVYHVDLAACRERGIVVSAGGAGNPHAVAEFTWALVLASLRHIPEEVAALRGGGWQTTLGVGLHGKALGIWGYGRLGRLVAGIGRAFGMRVLVHGREGSLARAAEDGFEAVGREALFARSDVLSMHLALNDATRGIVSAADLARMKPSALFVNTSRSGIVAAGALAAALRAGRPGRAAVDVFDEEPTPPSEPLIGLPNALCTPHLGYVEESTYAALFGVAIDQLVAFAEGRPINVAE
jgi:D-3-phosphoglycerate dehydrogenase